MPCKHKLVNMKYDTTTIRELSPSSLHRPAKSMANGCVKVIVTGDFNRRKTCCMFITTSQCFVNCNKSMSLTPKGLRKRGYETHLCQKLGYVLLDVILTGFLLNPIKVSTFYLTHNGSCLIHLECMHTLPCVSYALTRVTLPQHTCA